MNTKALSTPVSDLSCKAGLAVMEVYQKDFAIYDKSDNSPLTEADLAAPKMRLRRIKIKTATSCTESPFGYLPP